MGFQDVAFLPSRASFYTTFLKNCGGGCEVGTVTYNKAVVGGKQGHAPCKMFPLQQILILCHLFF